MTRVWWNISVMNDGDAEAHVLGVFASSRDKSFSAPTKRAQPRPRRRTRDNATVENADGTRSAQGCLNRTGLAYVKSLRTAGEDYAKLTNSALRCEAQTGRARVLAAMLRDISRNLDRKPDPLRIRWLDTRPWVRRPCLQGLRQRPFTPHPSQLRHITNMVHNVKVIPPRERGGIWRMTCVTFP